MRPSSISIHHVARCRSIVSLDQWRTSPQTRLYEPYLTTKGLVQFSLLNIILEDVERYGIAADGGHSRRSEGGGRSGEGKEEGSGFDLHLGDMYE